MNKQSLNDFLEKYSNNSHTEQEHQLFINWLNTAPIELVNQILEEYQDILEMHSDEEPAQYSGLISRIETRLNELNNNDRPVIRLWPRLRYIAAVAAVVIVVSGIYLGISHKRNDIPLNVKNKSEHYKDKVSPGGNKAILTLADGSTIILENAENGLLSASGGIDIRKTASGQIKYEISNSDKQTAEVVYNTITTPRGGQYHIVLSDGSKVWLNAASSLKFPASFSENERKVELTGEAYFEVAKVSSMKGKSNHIPFKVISRNQTVEVLGTHFNINAYPDEASINTTLLEGSVKVSQIKTNNSKILKPGQQSKLDDDILVSNVDPEQAIAWKNGYFNFSQENIESIMRKISRWYNVDIEYQGTVTREVFVGSVSRFEEVSQVLDMLELTGAVHFKIINHKGGSGKNERRIVVML